MASSQVLDISSAFHFLREISVNKIKLCFPCGCNDIHISPTKCRVAVDTVLKYSGSSNLYSQACAGNTWESTAKRPLRVVLEPSRISHTGFEPRDVHTTVLGYSSLHQETHQCCACFHSSEDPANAPAPSHWLGTTAEFTPSTHHPSTARPSLGISRIRPQDFLELAKLQILGGFNSKPGTWPDLLETGPVSFKPCYKLQQTDSGFRLSCETWNHMYSTWFKFLLWVSYTALWE